MESEKERYARAVKMYNETQGKTSGKKWGLQEQSRWHEMSEDQKKMLEDNMMKLGKALKSQRK